VELFNPIQKYQMLEKGRLDAIVQVCGMDGQPIKTVAQRLGFKDFEMLYPPYLSNPAYVVFSQKFVQQHEELAKQIVTQSVKIDKTSIYSRYKAEN
jgi:ABC-type nitrate/sulfonate/bicarbonate transport system substrate-binding protein